jgi:hypothetical protein
VNILENLLLLLDWGSLLCLGWSSLFSGLLRGLGLQNLLDNLLFLDQESTDNTVAYTGATAGTTVGAGDGLAALGELGVLTGSDGWDLKYKARRVSRYAAELKATVTTLDGAGALVDVEVSELSTWNINENGQGRTWSFNYTDLVGLCAVGMTATVSETLHHLKINGWMARAGLPFRQEVMTPWLGKSRLPEASVPNTLLNRMQAPGPVYVLSIIIRISGY